MRLLVCHLEVVSLRAVLVSPSATGEAQVTTVLTLTGFQ